MRQANDLSRVFDSKAELIKTAKRFPGIVLVLDGGDGWCSHWVSPAKGKEPKHVGSYNPQGLMV